MLSPNLLLLMLSAVDYGDHSCLILWRSKSKFINLDWLVSEAENEVVLTVGLSYALGEVSVGYTFMISSVEKVASEDQYDTGI